MKKLAFAVLASVVTLSGCASASKDISAKYVSPVQYQAYDCEQLIEESYRIGRRVDELGGRLDEAASNDKALTGVGLVLFWPALFALGGTEEQEAEFGRLKGEHEAVQHSMIKKKCVNQSEQVTDPEPEKVAEAN